MISFENLDLTCPKTWALIGEGNTKGVFQLESRLGQAMSKKLKPENIEQLAGLISILRPGCLEAVREDKTVSNHYIDKKNKKESIDYFHPSLEDILSETFGEMVYQEQAMQICQKIALFNLSEADMLRKAIGKKNAEEMTKIRKLFLDKAKTANVVTLEEGEQIFGWIEKSQRYSFNKSHAVSYAFNAYASAYAKTHYPHEFFTAYLRFAKDKIDPSKEINELVTNANELDIKVYRPDFKRLNKEFELIDRIIYFGITNIKGVGESVYNKIIDIIAREKLEIDKLSKNELLFSILTQINSKAAKNLIASGAFDYTKISRKKLIFELDIISNLNDTERAGVWANRQLLIDKNIEEILLYVINHICKNGRRLKTLQSLLVSFQNPPYSLDDDYEWIAKQEKQLLGISITCSVVDGRDTEHANADCHRINRDPTLAKNILVAAEVENISVVTTKKGNNIGKNMAFLKISDSSAATDIIIFTKEYEEYGAMLYEGNTLLFSLERSKDKESVFVRKCWQI